MSDVKSEIKVRRRLFIRPYSNGGWTVIADDGPVGTSPDPIAAFTSSSDMIAGLRDLVKKMDEGEAS